MTEIQPITEIIVSNIENGKPYHFNQDIANELLTRICSPETTTSICADSRMPSTQTLSLWVRGQNGANTSFAGEYARARLIQADGFANEIIDLSDNADNSSLEKGHKAVLNLGVNASETEKRRAFFYAKKRSIEATAIQIDARKWTAARMHPSNWGDKVLMEHTGTIDTNQRIDFSGLSTKQLEAMATIEKDIRVVGSGTTAKSKSDWPLLESGANESP